MKFAVCECGAKIMVVSDLHEMTRSIDAHAAEHGKNETEPEKAKAERYRIERQLARKVIMSIIDLNSVLPTNLDNQMVPAVDENGL